MIFTMVAVGIMGAVLGAGITAFLDGKEIEAVHDEIYELEERNKKLEHDCGVFKNVKFVDIKDETCEPREVKFGGF